MNKAGRDHGGLPRPPTIDVDDPDFTLAWPVDVFLAEAVRLLKRTLPGLPSMDWTSDAELLLSEAFTSALVAERFRNLKLGATANALARAVGQPGIDPQLDYLRELVELAPSLPTSDTTKPLWSQRRNPSPAPMLSRREVAEAFADYVQDLHYRGYLQHAFPRRCVDDRTADIEPSAVLRERLGGDAELWPLTASQRRWSDTDTLFDLIEVFDDIVMRPTHRWAHGHLDCGWHYETFTRRSAQALYRRRVNQLLGASSLGVELAEHGEDAGRLVVVSDPVRAELVDGMLERDNVETGDPVRHAIALFRGREADAETKKSAVIALYGVLEQRRQLLASELLSKDEGALFGIANSFAIRHQRADQKKDYQPEFLDWLFWWCLATIDLTDRLLERAAP